MKSSSEREVSQEPRGQSVVVGVQEEAGQTDHSEDHSRDQQVAVGVEGRGTQGLGRGRGGRGRGRTRRVFLLGHAEAVRSENGVYIYLLLFSHIENIHVVNFPIYFIIQFQPILAI